MQLPKKISPDRIKDAIIEFRINYEKYPYEIVIGNLLKRVIDSNEYNYVINPNNVPVNIQEISNRNYLFFNDNIKFQLSSKKLTINCHNKYISWENYFPEVENIINLLSNNESINISRIGLRYVSEFENFNLDDHLNFNFTFNYPDIKSKNFTFNSEFKIKNAIAILTLRNKMPSIVNNTTKYLSYIDIDVIKKELSLDLKKQEEIFNILNENHNIEKEIFFNLLKKDFLKTLNPEY